MNKIKVAQSLLQLAKSLTLNDSSELAQDLEQLAYQISTFDIYNLSSFDSAGKYQEDINKIKTSLDDTKNNIQNLLNKVKSE